MDASIKAAAKRYRYTGKERDEETGLGYHGVRYYVGWLGRWISTDPAEILDGPNAFRANRNNPLAYVDATGTIPVPVVVVLVIAATVLLEDDQYGTKITDNARIKNDLPQLTGKLSAMGLPVSMLETVSSSNVTFNYSQELAIANLSPGDRAHYNTATNELFVSYTDLAEQKEISDGSSIGTLFHESVHAWFDVNTDNAEVKQLSESGAKYYENAPLLPPPGSSGQQVASDHERVFQEAAATYVEFRVTEWLTTYESLQKMLEDPAIAEGSDGDLKEVMDRYNRRVGRQDFGYEENWRGTQFPTTKPISEELRTYLDQVILEGKMPSTFDEDQILKGMAEKIMEQRTIK